MESLPQNTSRQPELSAASAASIQQVRNYTVIEPESPLAQWRILRRWKGTLLVLAILGLLAGLALALAQKPVYQAQGSIEIQHLNEDFLDIRQLKPISDMDSSRDMTDTLTYIRLLESDTLLRRTVTSLRARGYHLESQLMELPAWRKGLMTRVNAALRAVLGTPPPAPMSVEGEAGLLWSHLTVRAAGQSRVVEVLVDSTNPQLAADAVNEICRQFIDQNIERRWNLSQQTGEWLAKLVDDVRIKLERSQTAAESYAHAAGLIVTSDGKDAAEARLRQLQEELTRVAADRMAKQSVYEVVRKSITAVPLQQQAEKPSQDYEATLADLRRQYADLAALYAPEHPKLKRLQAQITAVESTVQSEHTNLVERIRNDYLAAAAREQLLSDEYTEQARLVSDQTGKSITYSILQHEVDSNRQLYDAMLQRVKEATIAAGMRASNIRIVDAALPPPLPYKPNFVLDAGLGLFAGVFLWGIFVIGRERANRWFRQPGEGGQKLNLIELGAIPHHRTPRRVRGLLTTYAPLAETNGLAASVPASLRNAVLRHHFTRGEDGLGMVADSFRSVIASILFSEQGREGVRSFVITSPGAGEGKTTVVANLAAALGETGRRVLVVDGDLRGRNLHRLWKLPNTCGLIELLQNPGHDQLDDYVQATELPGVFLLSSGQQVTAPASLHSPTLRAILAALRRRFDIMLIDSPPVLQMPDARILAKAADAVILVVRAERTSIEAATAAYERISADGSRVLGMILNDWKPESSPRGYYGYYGRGAYAPTVRADKL